MRSNGSCFWPRSRMIVSTVSAFRITRTLLSFQSNYLRPFPVSSAFLISEYYGRSVALKVSLRRQSHVPSIWYVLAIRRRRIHPFVHPRWVLCLVLRGASSIESTGHRTRDSVSDVFR